MLFANGDAIIGDILRCGIMGGAFLAPRPNYPFFLYDLADKRVILESVQRVLGAGAQRLLHRPWRSAAARLADVLVNNAGYDLHGAAEETPWTEFLVQTNTNALRDPRDMLTGRDNSS